MYYTTESYSPEELFEYLRKSRSDDPALTVEEVLERHENILNSYAERHFGGRIPEENVFREVASSETIDGRPEMLRLLKGIESPKIKAVMVKDIQRLSRGDLEDAGRLIKLFRYTNTKIVTPEGSYDLRDERDRDYVERELKRGNEYLEYYKKIQANGRLTSVMEGNYLGSIAPYGYDKTFVTVGKKKCPTLIENKEQADVVRMIFDMYVNQDMGRTNICHKLDSLNIKPPKGVRWSPPALKDMLENIHYIGKVKWNWRKTVTIIEDQEVIKTRPKANIDEYLVYEGKHEAIISEELFNAAKDKQGRNHRAKPKTKVRNPLASILFCKCGKAMSLRTYKCPDGTVKSAPRLLCDGQVYCKTGSVLYDEMLNRVCQVLKECIEDFEVRLKNDEGNSIKLHSNLIKNLEKRKKELEEKELAQWEAQSSPNPEDRMPQHIFKQLNQKLLIEKEEVQQALCKAYESMPEPVDYSEKIVRFTDALNALNDDSISPLAKNKLLKSVFEKLEYTREKPYRLTKDKAIEMGISLTTGGNWYAPPFELDVKLKL